MATLSCLEAKYFMPAWWVRAYEIAVSSAYGDCDPFQLSQRSGVSPALTSAELTGVGVVLGQIQKDVLSGKTASVISLSEHNKHNALGGRVKTFGFQRSLQLLPALKVMPSFPHDRMVSIFKKENWAIGDGDHRLTLEMTQAGRLFLLGYSEIYSSICSETFIGMNGIDVGGSVSLSQAAWLDLQGIEQVILLRLEKSIQQGGSLVRLDGCCAIDLDELFLGLEGTLSRSNRKSPFEQKISILKKVGRKLVEHGLLNRGFSHDYLALHSNDRLQIVWKRDLTQIFSEARHEYESAVASYFCREVVGNSLVDVSRKIAGDLFDQTLSHQVSGVWASLKTEHLDLCAKTLFSDNGSLQLAGPLFLEWMIRQMPGHDMPLPETLKSSELARVTRYTSESDAVEKFKSFSSILENRNDLLEEVLGVPGGTLVSRISRKEKSIRDFLNKVSHPSKSDTNKTSVPKIESNTSEAEGHRPAIRKRDAAQELVRLRSNDPSQYEILKRAYLTSLDSQSKKIISEVQKRLQPQVFEDHIKHSLVKFMMDNPSVWSRSLN